MYKQTLKEMKKLILLVAVVALLGCNKTKCYTCHQTHVDTNNPETSYDINHCDWTSSEAKDYEKKHTWTGKDNVGTAHEMTTTETCTCTAK